MRLILRGVFDRFPNLQLVIGHMGEAVPFMMARLQEAFDAISTTIPGAEPPYERAFRDYFKTNIHITTSGFFDNASLQCALATVGAEKIMFAVDYPFSANSQGRSFIDAAPLNEAEREAIVHGNADRLLKLVP